MTLATSSAQDGGNAQKEICKELRLQSLQVYNGQTKGEALQVLPLIAFFSQHLRR